MVGYVLACYAERDWESGSHALRRWVCCRIRVARMVYLFILTKPDGTKALDEDNVAAGFGLLENVGNLTRTHAEPVCEAV